MNNDRFRIRVWNKKEKCFHYENWLVSIIRNQLVNDNDDTKEWYELMGCTGLRDSEGTLIWEGDIVRFWDKYNQINPRYDQNSKIVWKDGAFQFGLQSAWTILTISILSTTNNKVLGNIYEHPHLIKQSDPASRNEGQALPPAPALAYAVTRCPDKGGRGDGR